MKASCITGPAFDGIDNFQTAKALAAAIKKLGGADLILMGRAAADWDMGVVPTGVGEHPRHARRHARQGDREAGGNAQGRARAR